MVLAKAAQVIEVVRVKVYWESKVMEAAPVEVVWMV